MNPSCSINAGPTSVLFKNKSTGDNNKKSLQMPEYISSSWYSNVLLNLESCKATTRMTCLVAQSALNHHSLLYSPLYSYGGLLLLPFQLNDASMGASAEESGP